MKTGAEYRATLDDGRAVYFEGRKIASVTAHPAFARGIALVAEGYDRFYKPGPGAISDFLVLPRSAADLRKHAELKVDPILRYTYACLMTLLTAADRIQERRPQGADAIRAYVKHVQREDLRVVECITDAKGDRSKRPAEQPDKDAYVRVVARRPDGVVIRGAKLHISGAAIAHELMTIPTKAMKPDEGDYAIACAVPVNAPGVKIIDVSGTPVAAEAIDYPISAHEYATQGFVIFDDVFVPSERVFLDGETEHAASFAHALGLWTRASGLQNMADDMDMLVGFAQLITEANGLEKTPHIKDKIAQMAIDATLVRASLEAALAHTRFTADGVAIPDELYTNAGRYFGAANLALMVRSLHDIAGGSAATVPSLRDLDNPEIGALLRKYMSTKQAVDGKYRMQLFQAIRDLTADRYGGHRAISTIQAGGGLYAQLVVTRGRYDIERAKRLALAAANLEEPPGLAVPKKKG